MLTVVTAGTSTDPVGTRLADAVIEDDALTVADARPSTKQLAVVDDVEVADADTMRIADDVADADEEAETTAEPSASSAVEYAPTPYLYTPYSMGLPYQFRVMSRSPVGMRKTSPESIVLLLDNAA